MGRSAGPRVQHKNSVRAASAVGGGRGGGLTKSSPSPSTSPSQASKDVLNLPPLKRPPSASPSSSSSSSPCASHRSTHKDDCYMSRSGSFTNVLNGGGGEKCVCFICTCGKHHCPPAYKANPTPLDANTHYSQTYKHHDVGSYPERVVVHQSYVATRSAPGHFDTTQKAHYIAPEPTHHEQVFAERMERSRAPPRTSGGVNVGVGGQHEVFSHTSVHREDYPWHTPSPTVAIRPAAESPISAGQFYGNTTTQETYVGWKADPDVFQRTSHHQRNSAHSPFSSDASDFSTSYSGQYVEHGLAQRAPPKPKATYTYGSPRSFHTSNQLDFTGKQNPVCPAHLLPARPASARTGHVKYTLNTNTGVWA